MMYRFQVNAHTDPGEVIAIVGSTPELGEWQVTDCLRLQTRGDRYPQWWAAVDFKAEAGAGAIEYKYLRIKPDGKLEWEAWGFNRCVPLEPGHPANVLVVEDGWLGQAQAPYGYWQSPVPRTPLPQGSQGLKIVVIGSSVAMGCSAWLLQGWAWRLEQALHQRYGHQLVNVSELGANVSRTIDRFPLVVAPEQPDIVIIALSLGNEGLAHCPPYERRAVQRRFESGLQQLVKMTRELGARPILAGLYPNGDYAPEHAWLLRDTHQRMVGWDVPVLDWLALLDDGTGRWKPGISLDAGHPNTEGHRLMAEAISLDLFDLNPAIVAAEKAKLTQPHETPIYRDDWGFHLFAGEENSLRIINTSPYSYTLSPDWQEVQTILRQNPRLLPGLYVPTPDSGETLSCFSVGADGGLESAVEIPPQSDLHYQATFHLFAPKNAQILFYDGHVGLLKEGDRSLRVINETDHEYNIHPMWKEVRSALKAMPAGVYHDPRQPDAPFRTMVIGAQGLESRVKLPALSTARFEYRCPLSEMSRVALIPLGDRCAARMLLYKMEFDGPAFPFDLTRTTNLGDVADIIASDFSDMWNPALLHYNHEARRIYHSRWSGLSFAHEVEDTDDPVHNMQPVYDRMRGRYTARSQRFRYTVQHCDKALFIRTGWTNRGYVTDLMHKLEMVCQGKPFRVLLISPQPSEEFQDLPNVLHYSLEFNPDRMYDDLGYWLHCTEVMQGMLESLGVSSNNLFWCPPNPPGGN